VSATCQFPTACHTWEQIQDLILEVLHPPDLAPSVFHIFVPLKDAARGSRFRLRQELKEAVHDRLTQQPKTSYIKKFMLLWNLDGGV
jgi:hypothetical protein